MSPETPNRVDVVARITLGALPNICMLLILTAVGFYLWGQYRINAKLAVMQADAIDSAIIEGREYHHREGRLLRRIAAHVGMSQDEIDRLLPESTLKSRPPIDNMKERTSEIWLAF